MTGSDGDGGRDRPLGWCPLVATAMAVEQSSSAGHAARSWPPRVLAGGFRCSGVLVGSRFTVFLWIPNAGARHLKRCCNDRLSMSLVAIRPRVPLTPPPGRGRIARTHQVAQLQPRFGGAATRHGANVPRPVGVPRRPRRRIVLPDAWSRPGSRYRTGDPRRGGLPFAQDDISAVSNRSAPNREFCQQNSVVIRSIGTSLSGRTNPAANAAATSGSWLKRTRTSSSSRVVARLWSHGTNGPMGERIRS